jgi:NDP-sugar pyrophosphorylase family protein
MQEVLSLILGGGRGTRLYPLTMLRSKPAVPIAGKYRLIDIPISNCLNSGLNRVYVLTQFLSVSLHRHIGNTYKFDPFGRPTRPPTGTRGPQTPSARISATSRRTVAATSSSCPAIKSIAWISAIC